MAIVDFTEGFESYPVGTVLVSYPTPNSPFNEITFAGGENADNTRVVALPGRSKGLGEVIVGSLPDPSTTYQRTITSSHYVRRMIDWFDPDWDYFTSAEADFYFHLDHSETYQWTIDSLEIANWAGMEVRLERPVRNQYGDIAPKPWPWTIVLLAGFNFIFTGQVVTEDTWFNLRVEHPENVGGESRLYFNNTLLTTVPWGDGPMNWRAMTVEPSSGTSFVHETFSNWQTSPVVYYDRYVYIDNVKWSIQEKIPEPPPPPPLGLTGQGGDVRRAFS